MQLSTIVTTQAVRWIRIWPPWEKGLYNGGFGESKFMTWGQGRIAARVIVAGSKNTLTAEGAEKIRGARGELLSRMRSALLRFAHVAMSRAGR